MTSLVGSVHQVGTAGQGGVGLSCGTPPIRTADGRYVSCMYRAYIVHTRTIYPLCWTHSPSNELYIQDLEFFDRRTEKNVPVGVLVSDDVREMCAAVKHVMQNGITGVAGVTGGAVSLFAISPKLSVVALICIPVTTAAFNTFAKVDKDRVVVFSSGVVS